MIEWVDPEQEAGWDADVARWASSSIFHRVDWQRVLRDAYGYHSGALVQRDQHALGCRLPMMEVRSNLTGYRGISLPFTDECPALLHGESFDALFEAAVQRGLERSWRYIEFRGGTLKTPTARPSVIFHGHRLRLKPTTTMLFQNFDSGNRRAIRKAESSGLTIESSQHIEATAQFYRLLELTRQRHGVPPQPWRFFVALHRHTISRGEGTVFLAKFRGQPIAGAVFLHTNDQATYKYGASDAMYQHLRANNFVMWSAIQDYAHRGFTSMDFGRTSLRNEGLRRFKLGWGAIETQISYFKYDLLRKTFVQARDAANGWYNRLFRGLPLPLSRIVGTFLYKHIA